MGRPGENLAENGRCADTSAMDWQPPMLADVVYGGGDLCRAGAVSRFGSDMRSAETASSVLRARAGASGLVLARVGRVDLVASVVGADAWLLLSGVDSLSSPWRHGPEHVSVLAAILRRAAGLGGRYGDVEPGGLCSDALLAEAWRYMAWAVAQLGASGGPAALRLAAQDLCSFGQPSKFSAFGEVLDLVASEAEPEPELV